MKKHAQTILSLTAFLFIFLFLIFLQTSFASNESDVGFDYEIGDGELSVDIVDELTGNTIPTPVVNFGEGFFSNDPITSTGTLGTAEESIRVFNYTVEPKWELTLAAENVANAWSTAGTESYPYNDPTDVNNGRLTVNPQTGVRSSDVGCATENINQGSQATFENGAVDSITLLTAPVDVPNYCRFDFQNISLTQIVPGSQAVGTYTLPMVLTITAGNTEYPSEPQNLTVDFEDDQAILEWEEPETEGSDSIEGYMIERTDSPWSVLVANTNSRDMNYVDTTITGNHHQYRVSAVTHVGVGRVSDVPIHTVTYVSDDGVCIPNMRRVGDGVSVPGPNCIREGYEITGFIISEGLCNDFNSSVGNCSSVTENITVSVVWNILVSPFGENPASLDGVDFFDGDAFSGMLVWKTPGNYSITLEEDAEIEVLVVAGGGGGGRAEGGGGGGAGGVVYNSSHYINNSNINIIVGAGGTGGTVDHGSNGENSLFSDLEAFGGGGGSGNGRNTNTEGLSGGSGGGGSGGGARPSGTSGGSGFTNQGNDGGGGYWRPYAYINGGGGGGAANAGADSSTDASAQAGHGGDGLRFFGFYYAGGGGGGGWGSGLSGQGGKGGGGDGNIGVGFDAIPNTGAGGGGGSSSGVGGTSKGGDGGDGIIIARWGDYDIPYYNPTLEFPCDGDTSITDSRDGQSYNIVGVGTQCWMAKNLAYLPSVVGPATGSTTIPYYYVYGYNGTDVSAAKATTNYQTYGVLYNWAAAMNGATTAGAQGICPEGWHVPTDAEQHTLDAYLATGTCNASRSNAFDCDPAGSKMATFTSGGDNSSGFTALAGGYRLTNGSFLTLGTRAPFWSSSSSGSNAWNRTLYSDRSTVRRVANDRSLGFSVRCLRDN